MKLADLKARADKVIAAAHADVRAYVQNLETEAESHRAFTTVVAILGAGAGFLLGWAIK